MSYFKVIHNKRTKQHRWQLVGDNHEVVAHGETHPSEANAERAVTALKGWVDVAAAKPIVYEEESGDLQEASPEVQLD